MTRLSLPLLALSLITACASTPDDTFEDIDFTEAVFVSDTAEPAEPIERTVPLPLPGQLKPLEIASGDDSAATAEDAVAQSTAAAIVEPSVDGFVNAIQVFPYAEGALYRVYCAPGQITDIALEPGESLVSVSAGDTVRWVVGDTVSGTGVSPKAHVLVKPITGGISTNLMIATDRRAYHLELISVASGAMAALSWRYPADMVRRLENDQAARAGRTANSIEPSVSLGAINFDYRISGDEPDWRPVRVFDDGRQVFIQMPDNLAASDAPPLFVLGATGKAELVNYRVRGRYYIVDRLFAAAELRLGQTPQTIVRIRKGAPRTGLAALFGG